MAFTMKFLKDLPIYQDVQPYRLHGYPELREEQQTNCVYEEISGIHVEDLRNCKLMPRFEEEGFEFIDAPSHYHLTAEVFETEDSVMNKIVQDYVHETMQLVKDRLHSRSVITIDWRFRRNDPSAYPLRLQASEIRRQAISVATTVHCDFSHDGGFDRIERHLSASEWQDVKDKKVLPMIVNVWRPLDIVRDAPLILADRRTVSKRDVIESDQVMTDRVNKTAYVYHRPDQKWYWLSNQRPEEAIMFATWAPQAGVPYSDCSPHAAAYLHKPDESASPRQSVEVRMITFNPFNEE